jgi:hypothetical protein
MSPPRRGASEDALLFAGHRFSNNPVLCSNRHHKIASAQAASLPHLAALWQTDETEGSVTAKLARGTFAVTFFLAVLTVLEIEGLQLTDL